MREPVNKRLADARAFATKVTRTSSKLAHWEPEILELVRLKVSYRSIVQFLAERGTHVCVNAIYKFANAHKRLHLLQPPPEATAPPRPSARLTKAKPKPPSPTSTITPPQSQRSRVPDVSPIPAPSAVADSPVPPPASAQQAAASLPSPAPQHPPPSPPSPGAMPRLAWNPNDIDMKDLK